MPCCRECTDRNEKRHERHSDDGERCRQANRLVGVLTGHRDERGNERGARSDGKKHEREEERPQEGEHDWPRKGIHDRP